MTAITPPADAGTAAATTPLRRSRAMRWLVAVALLALVAAIVRTAWLADDAFITLRSVANLQAGHGPVWNVGERVQTFTHPLWFWLVASVTALTGEHQDTLLATSLLLATLAALALVRLAGGGAAALGVLALLLCSRAFVDYATSGLETPLTMLLCAALVTAATLPGERRLRATALVTGLLAATRLDLAVLCLPPLAAALRGVPRGRAALWLALGLSPIAVWTAFAVVYYGSPFPITAYAKAFAHGVPAGELAAQGAHYFVRHFATDPVTPAVVVAGVLAGVSARSRTSALALGLLLYHLYLVKVGGDYMLGRFLVPGFAVGAALLALRLRDAPPRRSATVAGAGIVATLLVAGAPSWLRPIEGDVHASKEIGPDGLVDERLFSYATHGWLAPGRQPLVAGAFSRDLRGAGRRERMLGVHTTVGVGYWLGDLVHVVDPMLCDPLLMRLPMQDPTGWRIGHFLRAIPAGYLETLATGRPRLRHPGLARYHDALRTVIAAPVFGAERWSTMVRFWSGAFDDGLADFVAKEYRTPPRTHLAFAEVAGAPPPSLFWFDAENVRTARGGGLAVDLGAASTARTLRLRATGGVAFRVALWTNGEEGHATTIAAVPDAAGSQPLLHAHEIAVPAGVTFDEIRIDVVDGPDPIAPAMIGCFVLAP